jgi:anaerobic selenocysteine-containing dehydrogenase
MRAAHKVTVSRTTIKTTCPRDCYDACGMKVVVEDGRVRKVGGDRDHPVSRGKLCPKCALAYNGAWIDASRRLTRPLRRAGAKGTGSFVPVSWDEAIAAIANRLASVLAAHGPQAILHTHYTGTCSAIAGNFPSRFFNRIGAIEVDPDTVCNKAGHEALKYVFGDSLTGFDPRTVKDAGCVLIWGANPSASAPHAHSRWLPGTSAFKIVVDPVAHATARSADLFLQPRPGTDAALAFAMMNAAMAAGLLRPDFISEHVIGWDLIAGNVEGMTPIRGETLTGVPRELIEQAALAYARGPSLLWLGQGMQRQRCGGNAFRSVAALCAATGNIGRPGAGFLYMNGPSTRGTSFDYVAAPHLNPGAPVRISQMDLAANLNDPEKSQALFCWNNNVVASNPQQFALRNALRREDLLHVVIDLFQTDTADYADFVLPAASFLEFDDLVFPYFHHAVSAQVKVVPPPGECLPNQEIFRRLARAMNLSDPELYQPDDEIIAEMLAQAGIEGGFKLLAGQGTAFPFKEPLIQFDSMKFPTPSGKIELASERAAADGHPLVPFPHADASPPAGRLRVLSPASDWTMNSSYANDRKIALQMGFACVLIHPREAATRAIAQGDRVELRNENGRLELIAQTTPNVPPGVALVHKGRWPKLDPNRANVNVLNPGNKSDMGESSCVHAVEAELRSLLPAGKKHDLHAHA